LNAEGNIAASGQIVFQLQYGCFIIETERCNLYKACRKGTDSLTNKLFINRHWFCSRDAHGLSIWVNIDAREFFRRLFSPFRIQIMLSNRTGLSWQWTKITCFILLHSDCSEIHGYLKQTRQANRQLASIQSSMHSGYCSQLSIINLNFIVPRTYIHSLHN
jgi:hypothetical protein